MKFPIDELREVVIGSSNQNIRATHKTTLEFTKDSHLSSKGDCIVAVAVDKALADLSAEFKEKLRRPQANLTIKIEVAGMSDQVNAQGSPQLILTHPTDMVIRTSDYICSRTLAVNADKAAQDLSRDLVEKLKNSEQKVKITLEVHA
jgi:hypothetical protein